MDALLDQATCGYVSFTDDGTLTAVNATLAALLGYDAPADLEGRHVETLFTVASRIFYQTHFFPLVRLHGKAEEIFLSLRARDGQDVPVLANAVRRETDGRLANHCVVIPVHQRRKYEDEILHAKRTAEAALQSNEALQQARRALEEHARDLDRRISQLEQRNDELTRFSTILSHDLREPIRKISVFAGILAHEDRATLTPMGLQAAETLAAECVRMDGLVRALHQYVALDARAEQFEAVDLNEALHAARRAVAAEHDEPTPVVTAEALPTIEGYRKQLELLFTHLLANAAKFARPGVPARVHVHAREVQHNSYRATEGRYRYVDFVQIVVEDNGVGFEEKYAAYVFEALRKLDPAVPGYGLGLALCKKVAEHHFGTIRATSRPGAGSRFTILLPLRQ